MNLPSKRTPPFKAPRAPRQEAPAPAKRRRAVPGLGGRGLGGWSPAEREPIGGVEAAGRGRRLPGGTRPVCEDKQEHDSVNLAK